MNPSILYSILTIYVKFEVRFELNLAILHKNLDKKMGL